MKNSLKALILGLLFPFGAFADHIQTMQFEGEIKTDISAEAFSKELTATKPDRWAFFERPQARVAVTFKIDVFNDIASIEIKTIEAQDHRYQQLHFRGICGGGHVGKGQIQETTPLSYRKWYQSIFGDELKKKKPVTHLTYKGSCAEFSSVLIGSPVAPVRGTPGDFRLYIERTDSTVKVFIATLNEDYERTYNLITSDLRTFQTDQN